MHKIHAILAAGRYENGKPIVTQKSALPAPHPWQCMSHITNTKSRKSTSVHVVQLHSFLRELQWCFKNSIFPKLCQLFCKNTTNTIFCLHEWMAKIFKDSILIRMKNFQSSSTAERYSSTQHSTTCLRHWSEKWNFCGRNQMAYIQYFCFVSCTLRLQCWLLNNYHTSFATIMAAKN